MMIEDMIRSGESETLEFKGRPNDDLKKYLKTMVAFSNTRGGIIIFGVGDDGKVIGLEGDANKIRDQIIDTVITNISPLITPGIYNYSIDGKDLVIVEINPLVNSLAYLRADGPEKGTYVRIGASTRAVGPDEIMLLRSERSDISPDSQICSETAPHDDDRIGWLCSKLSRRKGDEVTVEDLIGLGLLVPEGDGYRATMAFRLLTDNPYQSAILQCARFIGPGETEFADRTEFGGSILVQAERGLEYILSMIEKPSVISGAYRKDDFEIPVKAIREIVMNAVMHRSYRIENSPVFIAVFDDRVEITSPGGLPNGQTYERMMDGFSLPRNRIIARVFKECKLSEGWGRGLRRVFELCRGHGLKEPVISVLGQSIRVTLFRRSYPLRSATAGSNEDIVLRYFGGCPTMTIAELCESAGLSKHDAEVSIRSLKERGMLRREGARKRGQWIIETGEFEEE